MDEFDNIVILESLPSENLVQPSDPAIISPTSSIKKPKKSRISKKKAALLAATAGSPISLQKVGKAEPQLNIFKLIYRNALATQSNLQLYGREQVPVMNQYMETLAAERSIRDLRGMYNQAFKEDTVCSVTDSPANTATDYVSNTCAPYFYAFIEAYLKSNKST
uniref:Uncharacterized protein n=1 Tax=Ditylenchus dipsaci TaxID=166011 RepID=A0A915E535_9BILA